MTTITLPKKEQNFVLKKRDELLPKGVSQTIKNISSVDKSLSPTSKKQLENVILESFKKELCTIKWQNYLKNNGKMIVIALIKLSCIVCLLQIMKRSSTKCTKRKLKNLIALYLK